MRVEALFLWFSDMRDNIMRKITSAVFAIMFSISTVYADMPMCVDTADIIDVSKIEMPSAQSIDVDIMSCDSGIMMLSSDVTTPSVYVEGQATLTGSVSGGTISSDNKSITYSNGESASVHTISINPGEYTVDGFCITCKYENETVIKDFNLPQITGGEVVVNVIVNRPSATIRINTLKSDGIDKFDGSGTPFPYTIVEGEASDWRLSQDGHTIEEYIGDTVDILTIPNMIDGKAIFSIQNETLINQNKRGTLFGECTVTADGKLTVEEKASQIRISEGIKVIGTFAFMGCSELSGEIKLPYTVKTVGPYAFYGCSGISGDLDLSDCSTLYQYAFCGCTSLSGTLTLPAVTSIPKGIFADCPFSGELVIPEGVTDIGAYAFALSATSKNGVSAITLPQTLKSIGAVAFQCRNTATNAIELPEGLTHIGDFAFDHCNGFTNTSVTIPASVKTIGGDYATVNGSGSNNTGYGGHVFYDAFRSSAEFVVADGNDRFKAEEGVLLSKDGTRLVSYPAGKTDEAYIIPEGVTRIDEMAFGLTKVKTITLPDSFVFSTELPENVANRTGNNLSVALYIYNNCQNVLVNNTNPNYKSQDGIVYSKDGKTLWYVPTMHEGDIVIEDGCTTIKNGAFYCSSSTNYLKWTSINIPASVTEIEEYSLNFINNSGVTVTVDANNEVYTVSNNKIVKK